MNKTNTMLFAVIVVLALIFGIGQFLTPTITHAPTGNNNSSSGSGSPAGGATVTSTQIIVFVPQAASSTPTEKGSCWTNSIAAPFRADAWRCAVGNSISDPCFQMPNRGNELLCGINPAVPDATSTFVLQLTKPLPAAQTLPAKPPSDWAWLVQLADGTLCSPFTGTRPFTATGQAADYGCAPGPLGANIFIFDDLNTSSSLWLANVGSLSASTSSLPTISNSQEVPVAKVWQ